MLESTQKYLHTYEDAVNRGEKLRIVYDNKAWYYNISGYSIIPSEQVLVGTIPKGYSSGPV